MELTAWATLAAIGVYIWTMSRAGRQRVLCKVAAPSMDGPEPFLRAVRVQSNTLEQMPMLLAPLWMCAWFLGDRWAAAAGALWCVGRILYALAYYRDPAKRVTGYVLSSLSCVLLMIGTAVGLLLR
jgi:glutathione S-transferase